MRMAWRDWRSGELGLLLVALIVAIGTVTSVSLFVDRLHQALISESATFLAADRYIGSSREIPEEFRDAAAAHGITYTDTMLFPSMVFASDEVNQLVSVKAVAPGYPLRGVLKNSDVIDLIFELLRGLRPTRNHHKGQTRPSFQVVKARAVAGLELLGLG